MVCKELVPFPPAGEERMLHVYLPDYYDMCEDRYPVGMVTWLMHIILSAS